MSFLCKNKKDLFSRTCQEFMAMAENRLMWRSALDLTNPFIDETFLVMRSTIKWWHKRKLFGRLNPTFEQFFENAKIFK